MPSTPKVVLVDGSSLIYRAYFAIPDNLTTATGLHTNAILGFAMMFRKLFSGKKPDLGAVVFDAPGPTFREARYPEYKAQRPSMPKELAEQLPFIDQLVEANKFPAMRLPGYEADDVIGTLTAQATAKGMEVLIVSPDKDFAQLIGPGVRMIDTLRNITYDADLVMKKWGVKPEQMVDFLAIRGDDIDNIPGVPGVGDKGAAALLAKYGSLDGIYAHIEELKGKQRSALEEHKATAMLGRDLATIDQKAPVPLGIAELTIGSPDTQELNKLYRELQFNSLLSEEEKAKPGDEAATPVRALDTLEAARAALDALRQGPAAVVPIYNLPSPVTGALVGLGLSGAPGQAAYLPIAGEGPALGEGGLALARAYLEDAAAPKIVHNAKELWILCERHGITLRGVRGDTLLASFLVEPTKIIPHRFEQVVREYLQRTVRPMKRFTGAGQQEKAWSAIPVREAAEYAAELADALVALWPVLEPKLKDLGLRARYEEQDLPLAFVLGRMELDGIRVDAEDLKRIGEEFGARLGEYEREIKRLAGKDFNIASTKQLGQVLFEDLKLPVLKRTKTGYSTDSDVLERLAPKHEIPRLVVDHRKLAKLINTYTDVLQRAVNPATGRVHATFEQTVGATGRLISTEPDLQRTPVKTPDGKRIRKAFVADPGHLLLSADWSQIELRVLAHVSGDERLVESFKAGLDLHRRTAGILFSCAPEAVTKAQRDIGKTVNFATIYGQGATALAQILDVPRKDAQRYIDSYFEAYAGVRQWLDKTIAEAHERGYVTTISGRRRYIPELSSNNQQDKQAGERIAANTPIQGSAADLCKYAMLRIAQRLGAEGMRTRMLLQVHDELVFEAPKEEAERARSLIRDIMETAYPLRVPLVVDIGAGESWAEAH